MAFKRCSIGTIQSVPRKYPPHHHTTTTSLNRWDKAGWIYAFMFFTPNSDPTIWMSQQKSRLIRQATFLQSSIVQFWWSGVNCILRVLFLADMSGTRCGLVLLEPICFRVRRVVCSDGILYTLVVMSGYLSYCCFSIISNQSVHSPLTSDINKAFLNCCSLHIFSFSDYIYIYINISERPFLCWNIFSTFTWFYMKSHNLK